MRHAMRSSVGALALVLAAANLHAAVKVYDATEISYDRYRIIKRLWVGSWRTAFGVPHLPTREAAVQDLLQAAEKLGADGVVNLYCAGGTPSVKGYYCYGNAIEIKPRQ